MMDRRTLLAGGSAALMLAGGPAEAAAATRTFKAYLGSSRAGSQTISVERSGRDVVVTNRTDLVAKLLGIPVYRYTLNSREVWRNGVLQAITATGSDNGKANFVNAVRDGGGLRIQGSKFTGRVDGNPGSTSFFIADLLQHRTWISTQTGKPIRVAVANRGTTSFALSGGAVPCTQYHVGGQLKVPVDAYYATNGDLLGYTFQIKGQRARVVSTSAQPEFRPLWG